MCIESYCGPHGWRSGQHAFPRKGTAGHGHRRRPRAKAGSRARTRGSPHTPGSTRTWTADHPSPIPAQKTQTSSKRKERTVFLVMEQWGTCQEDGSHTRPMELGSAGTSPKPHAARTRKAAKTTVRPKEVFTVSPRKLTHVTVSRALRAVVLLWLLPNYSQI